MHEVLVWGIGNAYDKLRRFIDTTKVKINALVSSYDEDIKSIDGIDIIRPEQIKYYKFEFIIVASMFFDEIVKTGIEWGGGANREKFIDAKVFELNGFDFDRYVSIINKNVSIVSNNCWAGLLYNSLNLKFNTPFINIGIEPEDYFKLVKNIKYYLSLPLEIIDNGENYVCPKGCLGGDITIHFIHDSSPDKIKENWERRMKRFNFENYFVETTILKEEEAIEFDKLDIKNKIGFYFKEMNLNSVLYIHEWEFIKLRCGYSYEFINFVLHIVAGKNTLSRYIDVLKFLNGEKDFKRDIVYK